MAKKSASGKHKRTSQQLVGPGSAVRSTPIGDYGFLSDGEVSALLSPNGAIEWMCVPRFDSPSVFGRVLGREAGSFRVAPEDVLVPAEMRYLPGTMVIETSWGTPTGWIIVRDALVIGPWHHEQDRSRTYRRTPSDYEAEHMLVRTIRCVSGEVQTTMDCEPVFGYGKHHVRWELQRRELLLRHRVERRGRGHGHADQRPQDRVRGRAGERPHAAQAGRHPVRVPVLGRCGAGADLPGGVRQAGLDRAPLAALARPRPLPRPSLARLLAAVGADAQGPDLLAHGRDRRGRVHLAARDAGRQPQLRLPLHLDPRRHLRPVGHVLPRLRLGGRRLLLLHRRPGRRRRTTSRSCTASAGRRSSSNASSTTCPATRTPAPCGSATPRTRRSQHDVWGALLDSVYLHFKAADHLDNRIWKHPRPPRWPRR